MIDKVKRKQVMNIRYFTLIILSHSYSYKSNINWHYKNKISVVHVSIITQKTVMLSSLYKKLMIKIPLRINTLRNKEYTDQTQTIKEQMENTQKQSPNTAT